MLTTSIPRDSWQAQQRILKYFLSGFLTMFSIFNFSKKKTIDARPGLEPTSGSKVVHGQKGFKKFMIKKFSTKHASCIPTSVVWT